MDAETVAAKGKTETGKRTVGPESQAKHWATPQQWDGEGRAPQAQRWGDPARHGGCNLDDQVAALWPTPLVSAMKGAGTSRRQGGENLQTTVSRFSLPDPETPPGSASSPRSPTSPRRLNPRFVEWLMGLPLGYTDFAPLEMPSCLCKRRWRFDCLWSACKQESDGE
jgi:hypothetical protein